MRTGVTWVSKRSPTPAPLGAVWIGCACASDVGSSPLAACKYHKRLTLRNFYSNSQIPRLLVFKWQAIISLSNGKYSKCGQMGLKRCVNHLTLLLHVGKIVIWIRFNKYSYICTLINFLAFDILYFLPLNSAFFQQTSFSRDVLGLMSISIIYYENCLALTISVAKLSQMYNLVLCKRVLSECQS